MPSPEFRQDSGEFIQVLWRPKTAVAVQVAEGVTPQVTPQVELLLRALQGEMSRMELQDRLALKDRWNFNDIYLTPALENQLIEMTIPERPNSRLQKYRLTAKGQEWLAAQDDSSKHPPK